MERSRRPPRLARIAATVTAYALVAAPCAAGAQSTLSTPDTISQERAPDPPRLRRLQRHIDRLLAIGRYRRAIDRLRRHLFDADDEIRAAVALRALSVARRPDALEDRGRVRAVLDAVERSEEESRETDLGPEEAARWRRVALEGAWVAGLLDGPAIGVPRVERLAQPLDPAAAGILERLAIVAVERGDLPTATRALRVARRLHPTAVGLWADQAAVELARGRPRAAVALLREALRRRPGDSALRSDLAGALLAAGAAAEAVTLFASLAREEPEIVQRHLDLGRAALEAGDFIGSQRAAQRAVELAPESLEALHLLGTATLGAGDTLRARTVYRRILDARPDDRRAQAIMQTLRRSSDP